MRTLRAMTVAVLVAAALAGCGKNPAAGPDAEQRISRKDQTGAKTAAVGGAFNAVAKTSSTSKAAPVLQAPPSTPGVKTKTGAPAPAPAPAAPAAPTAPTQPAAPKAGAQASTDGGLKLTVRMFGTVQVGTLMLTVLNPAQPNQSAEIPLKLTGPEVVWEQHDVPPGTYTLRVKAFDPAGKPIGTGSTEARVMTNELNDLTLDLTVDGQSGVAEVTPTTAPSPLPTLAPSASPAPVASGTPAPAPTATPSPAPSGPGWGGTLELHVEVF